jgi:MFS family permease
MPLRKPLGQSVDWQQRQALYRNFSKLYALGFFFGLHLVVPIFVPLLQGHGLSMSQIMQTQAIFALTVAALELPSGYMADLWGRKQALIIGSLVSTCGFLVLQQATSFMDFIIFEVLMGIAVSLCSGADLALLYDTQIALDQHFAKEGRGRVESADDSTDIKARKPASSAKTFARLLSISSVAEGLAGLLATALLFWSLEWLLVFQLLISIVPVLIACTRVEAPALSDVGAKRAIVQANEQDKLPDDIQGNTQDSRAGKKKPQSTQAISVLLALKPLVLWIGATIIIFGLIGLYAFWLHQKYWELAGIDIRFFGCIWAAFCLVRAVAAHYSEAAESLLGYRRLLILACVLPLMALVAMAFAPLSIGIVVSLLMPLGRGLGYVVLIDALNSRIDGVYRATLNSLISLVSRAVFIVTGTLLGLAIDYHGTRMTAVLLLMIAAPCLILMTLGLLRSIDRDKNRPIVVRHY